jgi:hypothetical protein
MSNNLGVFNFFSPYLQDLLGTLEALAYLPSSYNKDENLSYYCFKAIGYLIESSSEKDKQLISFFMEKIYGRMSEAQDISKYNNNQEKLMKFQEDLCQCIQCLTKNAVPNLIKLSDEQIKNYFNIIDSYFKMREGVFEEGLIALSGLIGLISNDQNDDLIKILMNYITFCLQNYKDAENCKTSCLCLTDLLFIAKGKLIPYIKKIFELFDNIMTSNEFDKNIIPLMALVYADSFKHIGSEIWTYYQSPLNFMKQIINFCNKNIESYLNKKIDKDEFIYYIKLNEGLVDLIYSITSVLKMGNDVQKEAFKEYIPDIIEYIDTMIRNTMFNPSDDYLSNLLLFMIDFSDIYNNYFIKKIDDYIWQRVFQFANNSDDENIIHIKDFLQNQLFSIKMK